MVETALIFVGAPAAATTVLAGAIYGRTLARPNRYRPGRPWTYEPVWFIGNPEQFHPTAGPTAIPARPEPTVAAGTGSPEVGGASGEW